MALDAAAALLDEAAAELDGALGAGAAALDDALAAALGAGADALEEAGWGPPHPARAKAATKAASNRGTAIFVVFMDTSISRVGTVS